MEAPLLQAKWFDHALILGYLQDPSSLLCSRLRGEGQRAGHHDVPRPLDLHAAPPGPPAARLLLPGLLPHHAETQRETRRQLVSGER